MPEEGAIGHRLDSRQRESILIRLVAQKLDSLGALRMRKLAAIATLIYLIAEYLYIRGLNGGEREIRTPETLQIRGRNLAVPRSCGSLNHIVYAVCQDVAHFARECELSSALYASVFSASNQLSSIFPCRCPPRFRPFDPSCILIPNFRRRV